MVAPGPGYNGQAFLWTFCSAAIAVTFGRFYLRWRYSRRPGFDDLFNGIGLLCLIGYSAAVTVSLIITDAALWLELFLAQVFLYWTAIYAVKASFLALYWYVFRPSSRFRKAWWIVTVFTFLTYWPIVLPQLWTCGAPSEYANPAACSDFLEEGISPILIAQAAIDLALHAASDLLILVLPLPFIENLQMPRARKIGVAAVFAVIMIDIVCGILKNTAKLCLGLGYNADTNAQISVAMQMCEAAIAVIVCALPAYGVLLPSSRKRRTYEKIQLSPNGVHPGEGRTHGSGSARTQETGESTSPAALAGSKPDTIGLAV
ncbi:hypothetical protein MMC10_003574 [Thelotrema lepadinum]|nr:hypothetical protein [Thelotrema lepadinum]